MWTPLSLDLRVCVLAAVACGLSDRQVGERFGVSAWRALEREQDSARAKQMGSDQRSRHIEAHRDLILSLYEATHDITLQELRAALAEQCVTVGYGACGASSADATSRWKKTGAAEQDRPGVLRRREAGSRSNSISTRTVV